MVGHILTTFAVMQKGKIMTERKTIYLDDALEAIRKLPNAGIHWFVSAEAVFNLLLELPSAQPERWIPCTCSERLPGENYVLISKKPTKLSGSKWCVTIAIRTADPRSGKICWRDIGFGAIQDNEVLAWMPLPEPYREEGDK